MNIKQAKEEIKHTVTAYLKKDDEGRYIIPLSKTSVSYGTSGNWKDTDYGADCRGVQNRTGSIYDYPSYQTECSGTSFYQRNGICRQRVFHNGIYHE